MSIFRNNINKESDKNQKVIEKVKANIMLIKNSLSTLSNKYKNSFLNKMTLNLILVINLTDKWLWDIDTYNTNITRFLLMIMNELNEYGLEFCRLLPND